VARSRHGSGGRISPALAVALLALFAAIAGGSAVAINGGAAKSQALNWHKVKPNPHTATDPCASGKTGIFCGFHSSPNNCSFANFGNGYEKAAFAKDSNRIVHLRGTVDPEAGCGYGLDPFVLPKAYRPARDVLFAQACNLTGGDTICTIAVHHDGRVDFTSGSGSSGLALDGITFQAG
jgi:hypothetical protein